MNTLCLATYRALGTALLTAAGGALSATIVASIGVSVLADCGYQGYIDDPGESKVLSAIRVAAAGNAVLFGAGGAALGCYKGLNQAHHFLKTPNKGPIQAIFVTHF